MLIDIEPIPTLRPTFGHRASATVPCSLPDSQALLELSLREIETAVHELKCNLQALWPQLTTRSVSNHEQMDHARQGLHDICAGYVKHLQVIQERIRTRHHPEGRFGGAVNRLQTLLVQQTDRSITDQQQLSELSAEQNMDIAARQMGSIATRLRAAIEQLIAVLQAIRKAERQPQSVTLGGLQRPQHERTRLRDQLAWSLRRWWQTCTVQPGPMTIAVIDLHRLASDYPDLSRDAAAELLNAAAGLIVTDRRTGREGIAIDTTVISAEGDERYLSWSCAVIEDQRGQVQSVIAAGLDKTNSKPVKTRARQENLGATTAFSLPAPPAVGSERRRKERNPFPYVQLIAPGAGAGLPPTSAFFEGLCHDISEDGFSFLSAAMPSATSLVVALGTRPPHLYMTARVAHFTRCDTVSGAKYIVGCQFTGRAMVMAQFA